MPYQNIRINEIFRDIEGRDFHSGHKDPEDVLIEIAFEDPNRPVSEWGIERYKVTSVDKLAAGKLAVSALSGGDQETPAEQVLMEFDANDLHRGTRGSLYSPESN